MKVYILEYWHDCDDENCGIYGAYSSLEHAKEVADNIAKSQGHIEEFDEGEWEEKTTGVAKSFQKELVTKETCNVNASVFRIYTITECEFEREVN